jgi:hypothetical protein
MEDSAASYITESYIPANGPQLAPVLEDLPEFTALMASWLERLGKWMTEHNLDDGVSGPVTEMAGHARTMAGLAESAASTFDSKYQFWLS